MNILRCVLTLRRRNTRNKKLYRRYIADLTKGSDDIFDTKTLNLAVSISILTLRVQLVFANRERVYFEQQILTLLLVHPTTNLSRIKFPHIWRQVKGVLHLVKQSQGLPHEALHVATNLALILVKI